MADKAKCCSRICSTFEVSDVGCEMWHCHGEELGPFCGPILAASLAVFDASH